MKRKILLSMCITVTVMLFIGAFSSCATGESLEQQITRQVADEVAVQTALIRQELEAALGAALSETMAADLEAAVATIMARMNEIESGYKTIPVMTEQFKKETIQQLAVVTARLDKINADYQKFIDVIVFLSDTVQ